ncbi:Rust resistance kinase Lr10 [Senna tora]|uniref:Rust resistance kinase Lr10 n=1 Tax=Senna tora TaxID=362788 RepID=A0A834T5F9_9FABA|nr:Rust resistance kinase Lr10 [Senna tora]
MLKWSEPDCAACEAKGMKCGLVSNGASRGVQCLPRRPSVPKSTVVAATTGGIVGLILLLTVLLTSFRVYRNSRMKEEDQARVEKFLEDYAARRPTRFSYADINRITNGFKDKLGEGAHGAVFKGKLSNEILVAVKKLNNSELILDDNDEKEFINEVGTMGKIHHLNVVRLLGFCADGFHRALVYDFFPNGSLDNFLCPPEPNTGSVLRNGDLFLGWEKLQEITIGIARGIEYLHMGCDYQILHFDINPHNVLLDENFTPKISDFGLAKLCSKNQSAVSITAARGTLGYIAPEVFSRNFGNVSNKSDVYSFGMLLAEMVGGRKNTTSTSEENFHVLYPKWIHGLIEGGEEVHIQIEDEEDMRIAKKLAIVVLWCIQWHPMDRPSIKTVLQMLEGKGDKLKVPPTPLDSSSSSNIASVVVPPRRLNLELEVIHELE